MRRAWAAKHGGDCADAAGPHGSTARVVPEHRSQARVWRIGAFYTAAGCQQYISCPVMRKLMRFKAY